MKGSRATEEFTTFLTFIGFLYSVSSIMSFKRTVKAERFPTILKSIGFLSGISFMFLKELMAYDIVYFYRISLPCDYIISDVSDIFYNV